MLPTTNKYVVINNETLHKILFYVQRIAPAGIIEDDNSTRFIYENSATIESVLTDFERAVSDVDLEGPDKSFMYDRILWRYLEYYAQNGSESPTDVMSDPSFRITNLEI